MSSTTSRYVEDDELSIHSSYHDLLTRKNELIDNLEFDKAKQISRILKQRKKVDYSKELEEAEDSIWNKIDMIYETYNMNCETSKAEAAEKEFQIREKADLSFQETQERHVDELMRLGKSYALEILKAKSRPVAKQMDCINQAKKYAKQDNFKEANQFRMKGQAEFVQEHRTRLKQIEDKYAVIKNQYYERQKNELFILIDKLKASLKKNQFDLDNSLENNLKQFRVSVVEEQQRAIDKLTNQFQGKEINSILTSAIKEIVYEKMKEFSGIEWNPLAPTPKIQSAKKSTSKSGRSSVVTPKRSDMSGSISISSKYFDKNQSDDLEQDDFFEIPDDKVLLKNIYDKNTRNKNV